MGSPVKLKVFTEPGATNEFGEYRWWLHVWRHGDKEILSNIYPWPFAYPWAATMEPDAELLAAFMYTTKMRNWPGGWPVFGFNFNGVGTNGRMTNHPDPGSYFWKLAPGIGKQWTSNSNYPAYLIPEVFIKCICSK